MNLLTWGFDLILAATLLGLAWAVLFSRDHFRAVVLFIAMGLLMALVWVRLAAPEVALAEAAIGVGISGALLLSYLGLLRFRKRPAAPHLTAISPACVPGVRGAGLLAASCGTAGRLRVLRGFVAGESVSLRVVGDDNSMPAAGAREGCAGVEGSLRVVGDDGVPVAFAREGCAGQGSWLGEGNSSRLAVFFCGFGGLGLLVLGGWLLWAYDPWRWGPAAVTVEAMPQSGVTNQVTAVLLNFRSFDTLLELAVLLLAVVGVWSLGRSAGAPAGVAVNPILLTMLRGILPLAILIAGYLVWLGEHAPGGAFQGGAVLGAAGILLALAGRPLPDFCPPWLLRATLSGGLLVFLGLAAVPLGLDRFFFQYPVGWAGAFILAIEAAAAISIGLALCLLPDGGAPATVQQQRRFGKAAGLAHKGSAAPGCFPEPAALLNGCEPLNQQAIAPPDEQLQASKRRLPAAGQQR